MTSRLSDWCSSCWDCKNLLDMLLVGSSCLDNSDRQGIHHHKSYPQGWLPLTHLCSNIQPNMTLRKHLDWKTSSILLVDRMCSRSVKEASLCHQMFPLDKVWDKTSPPHSTFLGDRGRQRPIAKVWERKTSEHSSIQQSIAQWAQWCSQSHSSSLVGSRYIQLDSPGLLCCCRCLLHKGSPDLSVFRSDSRILLGNPLAWLLHGKRRSLHSAALQWPHSGSSIFL